MSETIGFIGTGLMGGPMAKNLLAAGHRVRVWNRSPEKLQDLVQAGAEACTSPRDAAEGASLLICMLSDGPTCDAVMFDDDNAACPGLATGVTLIMMSSIPVETAAAQAERCAAGGLGYLDAPVSGGQRGAIEGSLAIMVGGETHVFEAARPVLSAMGRPVHVGPAGTGQQTKLANQMIVAGTIATVAEALLFAERGGANPARVRDALAGGFADSTILNQHGLRMIEENFTPGGPSKYQWKDTRTALARARALGLDLPLASVADALFADLVEHGDGDLDHSALILELRRRNAL